MSFFADILDTVQSGCYNKVNELAYNHQENIARFSAIYVAPIDILCETLKRPLMTIELLAYAIINALGKLLIILNVISNDNRYDFKSSISCFEGSLINFVSTPVAIVIAPIKLTYQLFAIAIDPKNVSPFCSCYCIED